MAEIYHVLSRGIDKRKIFLNEKDHLRFIHDLFEFNDESPALNVGYSLGKNQYIDVGRQYIRSGERRRLLVKIYAFCLMPNHYHLLLEPIKENDVMLFMKKINGGYAKYFNIKYKRKGTLFEGKYKKILVKTESHFIHLPYYIHLNPLDLITPEWRDKELKSYSKAMKFLESYRWSSHLDYLGKKNFPSLTQREFLLDFFGGHQQYGEGIKNYLRTLDLESIKDVSLE